MSTYYVPVLYVLKFFKKLIFFYCRIVEFEAGRDELSQGHKASEWRR